MTWLSHRTIFSGLALLCLIVGALLYGPATQEPDEDASPPPSVAPNKAGTEPPATLTSEAAVTVDSTDTNSRHADDHNPHSDAPAATAPEDGPLEPSAPAIEMLPEEFVPLTEGAMGHRRMVELTPEDSAYSARLEAQQTFHPMEQTLMDLDDLSPETWREALETHRLRNAGIPRRAEFLRKSGHPEAAEELLLEWSRVYGTWQARAYGRSGPPGHTR